MHKLILSTSNPDKKKELKAILEELDMEIWSKDELGYGDFDVIEDADTLAGNATKKAKALWAKTGRMVIGDDTGLFVAALDGAPGVYAARYAGEHATYEDNVTKLLQALEGLPMERRKAKFETVIALVDERGVLHLAKGEVRGHILPERKGEKGFGYDPIFQPEGYDKSFAQLGQEEKNAISHRRRALEALKIILKEMGL